MTAPITETRQPDLAEDGDLTHDLCCEDDELTLCGLDASNFEMVDEDAIDCLVCNELPDEFCPKSGACRWWS